MFQRIAVTRQIPFPVKRNIFVNTGTYVFIPKVAEDYPIQNVVKAAEIMVTVEEAASNSLAASEAESLEV